MKYEFEQEYKKIGLKIAYYRKLELLFTARVLRREDLREGEGVTER